MEHRTASIAGRRVSYLEAGPASARTLLLLHAFPVSSRMWRPQLEQPAPGWRVLAPDLAGLGQTDDNPTDPPRLEDFADDAVRFLDHLGIAAAVVGGVSMGGYATLALARRAPTLLSGVVLADTKATADTEEARAGREVMRRTLAEGGPAAVAKQMLPRLLGETTRRTRPTVVSTVEELILANPAPGIDRALVRLRDRPDFTAELRAVDTPALVLVGEEDTVTPGADAQALAAAIPGARLAIIPAAGHLSNLENPTVFNALLAEFLSGLTTTRA